jgi:hypothetical protein
LALKISIRAQNEQYQQYERCWPAQPVEQNAQNVGKRGLLTQPQ